VELSIVILTFNSERTILNTLRAAQRISEDIYVVDSFSSDRTAAIVEESGGIRLVRHQFVNYSRQRNWAIEHLPLKHEWELHLDADEILSEELISELQTLKRTGVPPNVNGYFVPRLVHFLGRAIRHGGMFPIWHMRIFRRGHGRCEEREYDQHFVIDGNSLRLYGALIDDIRMPLSEWIIRHNRWSDAEVRELCCSSPIARICGRFGGNPIERKRYFRSFYLRMPLLLRPLLLFVYRYFVRCGFLDGREGLIFFSLQTFWFRFLVDAKIHEYKLERESLHVEERRQPNVE